jgi:sec-independent protein translocase protein TatB
MFDIGIGEIVIVAIVGLLIFGPERLPKAAADAAKWINQLKAMASGARKDLAESAGVDLSDTVDAVKSLQDLHPKRIASSLFSDEPEAKPAAPEKAAPPPPAFDPDAT